MVDCPALTEFTVGVAVREKSEKKTFKVTLATCAPTEPTTVMFKGFGLVAESLFTVKVLDWPALIVEGLNPHAAPPATEVHERAIAVRKELGADAEIVNVVEAVPMSRTVEVALAERENWGLPVPESATACEAPVESVMVNVPVVPLVLAGENVTLMLQLPLTFKTAGSAPQVFV